MELMASAQRYIPEYTYNLAVRGWTQLDPEPTYRLAVEAAEKRLAAAGGDLDGHGRIRVLLDVNEVDLTDREVLLGLMPTDPLLATMFAFARTQGMAGVNEVMGGPSADESWRAQAGLAARPAHTIELPVADQPRVNGHAPLQVAASSGRMTALADFLPLLQLALQSLLTNANDEATRSGLPPLSDEAVELLVGEVFGQARHMLAALGVTPQEMDAAALRPEGVQHG